MKDLMGNKVLIYVAAPLPDKHHVVDLAKWLNEIDRVEVKSTWHMIGNTGYPKTIKDAESYRMTEMVMIFCHSIG